MTPTSTAPPRKAVFITFYSFKGGVGRTMALLNAACILAGRGRRVLMVDFDLEAPGLSTLKDIAPKLDERSDGLVELIHDFLDDPDASPLADPDPQRFVERYITPLSLPEHVQELPGGRLDLLPCGRLDETYQKRLYEINFADLYAAGVGLPLFKHLKSVVQGSGRYDYVLVDARTGLSDEGSICTRDLADHIVVMMGLNRQNVEGTVRFLGSLKQSGWDAGRVEFVLSPVPSVYEELRDERIAAARAALSAAGFESKLNLRIPYHPRLALDEDPFTYRWSDTDIFSHWVRVQRLLREFAEDNAQDILNKANKAINEERFGDAIRFLEEARAEDSSAVAGYLSYFTDRLERSSTALREHTDDLFALVLKDADNDGRVFLRYGNALISRGEYERAMEQLDKALYVATTKRHRGFLAEICISRGTCLENQSKVDQAMAEYYAAVEFASDNKKSHDYANALYSVGELKYEICNYIEAYEFWGRSYTAFESIEDYYNSNYVLIRLSELEYISGSTNKALDQCLRSLKYIRKRRNGEDISLSNWITSDILVGTGRYSESVLALQRALKYYDKSGSPATSVTIRAQIGWILALDGKFIRGRTLLNRAIQKAQRLGFAKTTAFVYLCYAKALADSGHHSESSDYLAVHWEGIHLHLNAHDLADVHTLRAKLRLISGNKEGAREDAQNALSFYSSQQVRTKEAKEAAEIAHQSSEQTQMS